MSDFMQPEVFEGSMWIVTDNNGEAFSFPADYFSRDQAMAEIRGISDVELVDGWWGRYQAPGYLDSTDWSGPYDSEAAALEDLEDMYGNDGFEDEEDDDGDDS